MDEIKNEEQTAEAAAAETAHAEVQAAAQRDPATVAHEQRFGGASAARNGTADAGSGSDVGGDRGAGGGESRASDSAPLPGMRPGHRLLTDGEVMMLQEIDYLAGEIQERFNEAVEIRLGDSNVARCLAVARTNLEQAIMWATKGITA